MLVLGSLLVLSFGAIAHGAPRIVGGHDAPNHKYPYQVSLRDFVRGHFCSGSIVNSHWILSAAHCFEGGRDSQSFSISAGTNYLDEQGDSYLAQFYLVHEEYLNFYHDDVAIIRVRGEIKFNEFVTTISLPQGDFYDYNTPARMAGWGSLVYGGDAPNALQEIELKILTLEQCKVDQGAVTRGHICTLNKVQEGICHGDSGGPLVVNGVQVGIASYVVPCAVGIPDVFTRVWSYVDWIEDKMERFDFVIE